MTLPSRTLGKQGFEVSVLGLGCTGMSQSYGPTGERESIATIHRAIELGVTLFDTAEVYGPFTNEELLGRALKGKRNRATVATKFGWRIGGTVRRAEEYPEDDYRKSDPRFQGANFDANMSAAQTVRDIAQSKGATPAQVALAWLLHQGDDIVPIPGTKRRHYLEENVAAAGLELSAVELHQLDRALPPGNVAGPRYNERQMQYVDR